MDASPLNFSNFETKNFSIFVDRVLDPGNLGAIGRSAWYFGADGICLVKGRGLEHLEFSIYVLYFQTKDYHAFYEQVVMWRSGTSPSSTI